MAGMLRCKWCGGEAAKLHFTTPFGGPWAGLCRVCYGRYCRGHPEEVRVEASASAPWRTGGGY